MAGIIKRGCFRGLLAFAAAAFAGPALAISVSLTAPAANAVFQAGSAITLSANATPTNTNRPIVKVEFFRAGSTLIGTDTTSPYSFSWTNVPAGSYTITAKATDSTGATAISAARTIKVNAPPAVTLTAPVNGATFNPGSTIALTATASDTDGTVSKVDFLRGGTTLIGTDTSSPYSFNWTNVASGTYTLTARATDSDGAVTTSAAVTITVDTAPTVSITSPANNAVFLPGAAVAVAATAADADGTVAKVDFFDGANLVATDTASPYSATLTGLVAGTHSLTARATDNLGRSTTSAPVTIRVDAPPTVSISSPVSGTVFPAPASVTISATASDPDGTVSKVDFFDGATLVGTGTAAPYSVALANVTAGTHAYSARATDNNGATATSTTVTVVVNVPPTVSITAPAANALFNAPAAITVTANAADADGTVSKVDFFDGATLVGTATASPYSVALVNVPAGAHSYTARATDDRGMVTTSAAVNVTVDSAPTVGLASPVANAVFASPATIPLSATASASMGTIAKVDFYQGSTLIGTAVSAPYTFNWTNVAPGSYALSAVATNDAGGATTSAQVPIRVDAAPSVTLDRPANNSVFASPATITLSATPSDAVGVVTKVDFYQGATLIGTATAAPFSFVWSGVSAGLYSLSAIATNDAGMTGTSSAIAVTVDAPPSVAFTSPVAGARFSAPAVVVLAASAADTVGVVTKVDFFQGTALIGTASAPPFNFTWTNVAQGNYSLSAVATNDAGTTTTSAPIAITVSSGVAQLYVIHTDHLNTPRLLADSTGTTVWRWDQGEPFGNTVPNQDPDGDGVAFDFPLRFPGQYADRETNVTYNLFRDYDPGTGRYVQSDPIGLQGGLNTYSYGPDNPLSFIDPSGLQAVAPVLPGGGLLGGKTDIFGGNGNGRPSQPGDDLLGTPTPRPTWPFPGSNSGEGSIGQSAGPLTSPGRCTQEQHRRLQDEVNAACKIPRRCDPSQDCPELLDNYYKNIRCAQARDEINNTCFAGGDAGHRQAANEARKAADRCIAILQQKGCANCPAPPSR